MLQGTAGDPVIAAITARAVARYLKTIAGVVPQQALPLVEM
jgi:hypothetical protein